MAKKIGWKVDQEHMVFKLLPGYELREEEDFTYLYYGSDIVATFSGYASPDAIKVAMVRHNNRRQARAQSGFTIIELLVVFALILLIIGLAFPLYNNARNDAQQTAFESQLRALEQAAQMHVISGGGDVIWHAAGGEPARDNPTGDHESWMLYFDRWPENPLDTGSFTVEIQGGEIMISPGVE